MYSILEFKIFTKNMINGGDFGFEGSIICLILQLLAILFIVFYFRKKIMDLNSPKVEQGALKGAVVVILIVVFIYFIYKNLS